MTLNSFNHMIRKATSNDLDGIEAIYNKVLDQEEANKVSIGWIRGVYPTRQTAESALLRDDLFVYEKDGNILATAIINKNQLDIYAQGNWHNSVMDDEVMVLHTLVVSPNVAGKGIGRAFVTFYEQYAKEQGCKDLRMDTQAKNQAARHLYHHLGYEEVSIIPCPFFNGIEGIELVLLEKSISDSK